MKRSGWFVLVLVGLLGVWMMQEKAHGQKIADRGYPSVAGAAAGEASPAELRALASEYYRWRTVNYPVETSDQGLHTRDAELTDYTEAAIAARREHTRELLEQVRAMATGG